MQLPGRKRSSSELSRGSAPRAAPLRTRAASRLIRITRDDDNTLYRVTEPHASGMLDVGDGHRVYWEARGNPRGKPAVFLHGGPGSGCWSRWAELFDPDAYQIVLFDQRGCGRSEPNARRTIGALTANTTQHLIEDIEKLRTHLGIDRWLLLGVSWGSVLGLSYAQAHPERTTEIVLFSVTNTVTRRDVERAMRSAGRVFPSEWQRFLSAVNERDRDGALTSAYYRLLCDPDPAVHQPAADAWCEWDDRQMRPPGVPPNPRYLDPSFRLCSARLVTHYWSHGHWLSADALLDGSHRLAGIPGVLIHGSLDLDQPVELFERFARDWPEARLVMIPGEGHTGGVAMNAAIVEATDSFAAAL